MSANDFTLTIKPACKKCGASDRSPAGKCRICVKRYTQAWRAGNPEKVVATAAANYLATKSRLDQVRAIWRKNNPEKQKIYRAKWYAANSEQCAQVSKAWKLANADKVKEDHKAWKKVNREKLNTQNAEWRKANPEKSNQSVKLWRASNPDAVKTYNHTRRALKKAVGGKLSLGLSDRLFKLQQGKCPCCKELLGIDYQLDHKMPLFLGGSNTDDNIQLLRRTCNSKKRAKHPIDYMQSKGFLL